MKVLHVSSEAYPLVKTGGLADVVGALPAKQRSLGIDAQLMLPAYPGLVEQLRLQRKTVSLGDPLRTGEIKLHLGCLKEDSIPFWLVECDALYNREGGPYQDTSGNAWEDNPLRFAALSLAAAMVADAGSLVGWQPDIVHCHDWQAGLTPAYLSCRNPTIKTVFTAHNLQHKGLFSPNWIPRLNIPRHLYHPEGLEFHGRLSFIKSGLVFSDHLTAVSPTYAQEIQTPAHGEALEGVLRSRGHVLTGVLNGIDLEQWSPEQDKFIAKPYNRDSLDDKKFNKQALQEEFGLPVLADAPLIGVVSRLVEQKGLDLLPPVLPKLLQTGIQLVVLGTGDPAIEQQFLNLASEYPGQVAVRIGYDEGLSHRIQAGSDMFLIPSRFEPCGLTQMYAMRYGTLPIVRRTGGLADTITDWESGETRSGFVFNNAYPESLADVISRGVSAYGDKETWRKTQLHAMSLDFGWEKPARIYQELYQKLMDQNP